MRRLVAAGGTDKGQIREGNEDAILVRESVFAVADGMGGHLAGEVASATALEPIEKLDSKVFSDAGDAVAALSDAVVAANATVSKLAEDNPAYRGMGTTLTAAMIEGRRLHVAHVGDSRAYLLRDGTFNQLTDDHTLVQHLVNEGQITPEEAAIHPQRSIITRAIGVSPEVEVDAMSLDLDPGDQLLLCSDGLTGVVEDREIARVLTQEEDPDEVIRQLIRLANEGGGPDNITVLLLRYEDTDAAPRPAPPADRQTIAISSREDRDDANWAGQLGTYGSLTRGGPADLGADDAEPRQAGRILGRAATIAIAIAVVGGLVFGGGQFLLSRSYFVGLDDDEVVIFQGVDAAIGPLELARVAERTELTLDEVPSWYHPALEAGRTAADLGDARRIVATVPLREDEGASDPDPDDPDPDDSDGSELDGPDTAGDGDGST